jgi:hypothetical protein
VHAFKWCELWSIPILMLVGCGSSKLPQGETGIGGMGGTLGSGGGSSGSGGASGDADNSGECAASPPADGGSCQAEGLSCSWGDDIRGDGCRTRAVCSAQTWQVTPSPCLPLTDVGSCPGDLSAACTADSACTKADGNRCRCTECKPNAPSCGAVPTWYCPAPTTTVGCPPAQPNLGTSCGTQGLVCRYPQFACGQPDRVCDHGIWTPGDVASCPM